MAERADRTMDARPGHILESALAQMRRYLCSQQGQDAMQKGGQDLSPIVESYLSSVLLPAAQGTMSLRNKEELKLLSQAIDHMLKGNFVRATELLVLRFQAVEMCHNDGNWNLARHVVPTMDAGVSSMTRTARAGLLRDEQRDLRARSMAESSRARPPER